ncbi:hypothetical protein TCE0_015r02396 [Talaromyces pinophilus]|uniref:Uncharacterized protein n=1 Tax=Talaromyces pinophilus TaxID=128442 RepID=A0A6V8H121_TALPI|nr:hypothetical protein TCE0_015r02396 [Talaromyces pinophilus]
MNDASSRPNYQFGVELEVFLVLKSFCQNVAEDGTMKDNFEERADHIVRLYNNALSPQGEADRNYPRMVRLTPSQSSSVIVSHSRRWEFANPWQIKDEPTLYMYGIDQSGGWPVEFASPIFDYQLMMGDHIIRGPCRHICPWVTSIKKFFEILQDQAIVLKNDKCALQVSVSANDRYGWDSLDQVKSLSKSILYFERAIRSFLPQYRQDNDYAKWNGSRTQVTSTTTYMNPQFPSVSNIESRIALVDACATVEDLVRLMNNRHKRWSWNFTELQKNPNSNFIYGRVEFRSPPGVDNWSECVAWIHFTVEFLHAAISTNATMHRFGQFSRDLTGLIKFLDSVPPLLTRGLKATYRRELTFPDHWIPDIEPIL